MPFPAQIPKIFNKANIESLYFNQMGVYGLYRPGQWIYVGKGDIRKRLMDHLNGDNPIISKGHPTYWVYQVTENMDAREKQLILELDPI